MNGRVIGFVLAATFAAVPVAAHPGHNELKRLVGTVIKADSGLLQLETFDQATLQQKRIAITIDAETKWFVGKKKVPAQELAAGEQLEVVVRMDDMPDGTIKTRADQIKRKEPRKGK